MNNAPCKGNTLIIRLLPFLLWQVVKIGALETSAPPENGNTNVTISPPHHHNIKSHHLTTTPSQPHYLLNGLAVVREAWYLVLSAELALRAQPVVELSFACYDNL